MHRSARAAQDAEGPAGGRCAGASAASGRAAPAARRGMPGSGLGRRGLGQGQAPRETELPSAAARLPRSSCLSPAVRPAISLHTGGPSLPGAASPTCGPRPGTWPPAPARPETSPGRASARLSSGAPCRPDAATQSPSLSALQIPAQAHRQVSLLFWLLFYKRMRTTMC